MSGLVTPDKKLKQVRLTLPKLHAGQIPIFNDKHRIVIATAGTKAGKTFCMSAWLVAFAFNRPNSLVQWIGPIFRTSRIAFLLMQQMLPRHMFKAHASDMCIELLRSDGSTYSRIECRSADNPGSLRGEGVHAVVLDEAAYAHKDVWTAIRTTTTRTRGYLRAISTPKGRNHFWQEWMKGLDPAFPEYSCHQMPTSSNPTVSKEALEELKRTLPADIYRQECLAEFLSDGDGAVFTGIARAQRSDWLYKPEPGRRYVVGIDWAKAADFTVFMVGDIETKSVVHMRRFTGRDWNQQVDEAIKFAKDWNNASVLMDSTGVGDVVFDLMAGVYSDTSAYGIFNNTAKCNLIQALQLALERNELGLPNPDTEDNGILLSKILQSELESYSYDISSLGKFQYAAPPGMHDDCVIALALCWWQMNRLPMTYKWRSVRGV